MMLGDFDPEGAATQQTFIRSAGRLAEDCQPIAPPMRERAR
jgi:hypothetical protein